MESLKRTNVKLRNYSGLIGKCSTQAALYAACVTTDLAVKHNACEKEFNEFKNCLKKIVKK